VLATLDDDGADPVSNRLLVVGRLRTAAVARLEARLQLTARTIDWLSDSVAFAVPQEFDERYVVSSETLGPSSDGGRSSSLPAHEDTTLPPSAVADPLPAASGGGAGGAPTFSDVLEEDDLFGDDFYFGGAATQQL